jgi:hypothetical protein
MSDIALILSADKYEIPDSKTGEVQNLHQLWMSNEYRVSSEKEKGCKPMKVLVEPAVFEEIMKHELPGLFDVDIKMRPGKGNTVAATVVGFRFLSNPKIFPPVAVPKAA